MARELSEQHARWLEARKIPCELAAELGLFSRGRALGFPYSSPDGGSFTKWRGPAKSFWVEPAGTKLGLWLLDRLAGSSSDTLVWTEGELDAMALLAAGVEAVVSVPNGTTDRPGHGNIDPLDDKPFAWLWQDGQLHPDIARFKRHVLATDGDHPGQVLRDELAIRLGRKACWHVRYPESCKDANDVLLREGPAAALRMVQEALPIIPDQLVPFSAIPRGSSTSVSSGWGDLDQHLMFAAPEVTVISGPPNHGKSQWGLALVANLARVHGMPGAIIQFEDDVDRHRDDLIRYARAWRTAERHRIELEPEVWMDRMFTTIQPPEAIHEAEDKTLEWLKERIHEAATRHGAQWVLIDPWNEVEHLWGGNETETAYTGRALRHIRALARTYRLLIIIVTHPSKAGGFKTDVSEMTPYDISGSAHWANKPDHVLMIHRPKGIDETMINIAKCRDYRKRGTPGVVRMRFDPRAATFHFVSRETGGPS